MKKFDTFKFYNQLIKHICEKHCIGLRNKKIAINTVQKFKNIKHKKNLHEPCDVLSLSLILVRASNSASFVKFLAARLF